MEISMESLEVLEAWVEREILTSLDSSESLEKKKMWKK
jgi:hypothetical protein